MVQSRVSKPFRYVDGQLRVLIGGELRPAAELKYEELLGVAARFHGSEDFAAELQDLGDIILVKEQRVAPGGCRENLDPEFVIGTTTDLDRLVPWGVRQREAIRRDKEAARVLEHDAS